MPARLLYALMAVVVLSFLLGRKGRKARAAQWTGVVTNVQHQRTDVARDEDRGDQEWVRIHYRTDAGAIDKLEIRVRFARQFLAGVQVGDRLVKLPGDYLPRRATAATEQPVGAGETAV